MSLQLGRGTLDLFRPLALGDVPEDAEQAGTTGDLDRSAVDIGEEDGAVLPLHREVGRDI